MDHILLSYLICSIFFFGSSELLDTENQIQKPLPFPKGQERSCMQAVAPSVSTEPGEPRELIGDKETNEVRGLTSCFLNNSSASLCGLPNPVRLAPCLLAQAYTEPASTSHSALATWIFCPPKVCTCVPSVWNSLSSPGWFLFQGPPYLSLPQEAFPFMACFIFLCPFDIIIFFHQNSTFIL